MSSERFQRSSEEMEITEHLTELRARLIRVFLAFIPTFFLTFIFSKDLIKFLWFFDFPPYVFSPLEWILVQLTLSLTISIVLIYPYFFFEIYQFTKPGLYENEIRFLKTIAIPSYIFFALGFLISVKILVPFIYSITIHTYEPYLSASLTLENAIKLSLAIGFFTQIPLVVFLLIKFSLVSYKTLKSFRIFVYFAVFMFFMNLTADFGSLALFTAFIFFIFMFEVSLLIARIAIALNILKD